MNAEIISIGNELLSGRIVDTNAAHISKKLAGLGIGVARFTVVGDDLARLTAAVSEAVARGGLVIATGGLGPTEDDRTRDAVAAAAGVALSPDAACLEQIRDRFRRRGRRMAPSNEKQALLPGGAAGIPNPVGTAPGIDIVIGACRVFVLPGVPSEMEAMLEASVLPALGRGRAVTVSRILNIFGLPESVAGEAVGAWMTPGSVPEVGITAEDYVLRVSLTVTKRTREEALAAIRPVEEEIRSRLGDAVFGRDGDTLPEAVSGRVRARGLTLAVAESCTGGLVAHRITNVPGASEFLMQGIVAYGNEAKRRLLGVSADLLERRGAVSEEVARAMAEGVRARAGTSLGVGVTGIAGPGGGTPEKPVGLVYAAVAGGTTRAERFLIHGNRVQVQDRAAKCVLNILRLYLIEDEAKA